MARTAELTFDDFSMKQFSLTAFAVSMSRSRLPGFCRTLRMRPPTLVDVQVCVTKLGTAARSSRCAVGQKSELQSSRISGSRIFRNCEPQLSGTLKFDLATTGLRRRGTV